MDRMTWMLLRAYLPVAAQYAISLLILLAAPDVDRSSLAAPIVNIFRFGSFLAMSGGTLLLLVVSYRLWRWERGEGHACPNCGGPLGGEKAGIWGRGGYRTCLQCNKNVNERLYS